MNSNRIPIKEAKKYIGLRNNLEFQVWCEDKGLQILSEGKRDYLLRGMFLVKADEGLIDELRAYHDGNWVQYYEYYELVRPFLKTKTKEELALDKSRYVPESELALGFYKTYVDVV